jgi:hypothetical protein
MAGWSDRNQQNRESVVVSSIRWIALILAVVITFFVTPLLYRISSPFVGKFTYQNYGPELVTIVEILWFPVVGILVFCVARGGTGLLLMIIQFFLAARSWR